MLTSRDKSDILITLTPPSGICPFLRPTPFLSPQGTCVSYDLLMEKPRLLDRKGTKGFLSALVGDVSSSAHSPLPPSPCRCWTQETKSSVTLKPITPIFKPRLSLSISLTVCLCLSACLPLSVSVFLYVSLCVFLSPSLKDSVRLQLEIRVMYLAEFLHVYIIYW